MVAKRKLLSYILTLSMLCSGMCVKVTAEDEVLQAETAEVSQAESGVTVQPVSENISNLLQALELMDVTEVDSRGYVTRGFAAEVLSRVDNRYYGNRELGNMYVDVPADHIYAYAIETMSECRYLFGVGYGAFNPDGYITPTQMATVLLRLAGYPNNSIPGSEEFGKLLRNTGVHEYLAYPELATMLYNFLEINIIEISGAYTKTGPSYTKSTTETILSSCLNVVKVKGTVTENGMTGLWSGTDIKENSVAISEKGSNVVVDAGETDIGSMLGAYVEAYCRYDDSRDLSVCIYYNVPERRNKLTEIDIFDIDYGASTATQIYYYPDGDERYTVKYDNKTAIIYNGTYYSDTVTLLTKISTKDGKITVIDNNNDSIADVLNVEAYDTYIVSSVNLNDSTVFFKNSNQSISLNKEDYNRFALKDKDGNDCYVEDFGEGLVLSIAQNSAGASLKTIKGLVSEETVNGTVTATYQNDFGNDVVQLDSMNEYTLLKGVALPNVGQGVRVLLNAFGRAAWVDYSNAGEYAFGIITRVSKYTKGDSVKIKMITAQNAIEIFEVKDKLTVDKTTYKDMDTLYTKLLRTDNIGVGNVKLPAGVYPVRYKLRADGSLAELDTEKRDIAAGENANTLEFLDSGFRMLLPELVMGGTFALKSSTPVFRISGSTKGGIIESGYFEDIKYMSMSNVNSSMSASHKYNYAAYKVDKDSVYADFLIISSTWGEGYDNKLFVIEKISTVYDDLTDSVVKCVQGVENGSEKKLLVSDFYADTFNGLGLQCGDVIRYDVDGYGYLIDVENDYCVVKHDLSNPAAKKIDINNISSGRTSLSDFRNESYSTQMIFGYVKERRGNFITISSISPNTHNLDGKRSSADMGNEAVLIKIPETAPITVFDPTKEDKVYTATYDEILDYKHNSSNCSLVALHFRTGRLMDAVVLNDYSLYK